MKPEQMQKYCGIQWHYLPDPVKTKLVNLYKETGYVMELDTATEKWKKKEYLVIKADKKIWHDGI